ncbi:MAG: HPr kinase/phosphorylase [Acetobacteraceae bacterium]
MLLVGPPGSGKSDLLLRLIDHGFTLVSDDRVEIADGVASAPETIAGLIEVRGLGLIRLPYTKSARLALAVALGANAERLPRPGRHAETGLPMVALDANAASAPVRVRLALDCVLGYVQQNAGAFAA